ncbi:MAG: hypothetical protein WDN23_20575 [Edaphobacter sp.]
MRLPFPERIPIVPVCYFAGILCVIQLLEKTDGVFALCCLAFILVAAVAFNLAGGLAKPSGAYVFFFATLTLIVGLCCKAVLGEPADSNLQSPRLTISIYLADICGILAAVLISRKLATKKAILKDLVTDANMQRATVGCMITGFLIFFAGFIPHPEGEGSGTVLSALNQINQFFPLAIVLGTIHTIRRSGGTRSINLPVLISILFSFGLGLYGFSKQGIIAPLVCWLIAACSQRYEVTKTQIAAGFFVAFLVLHYLVPFAQYGRSYREETAGANLDVVISLLSNLDEVRAGYLATSNLDPELDVVFYNYYDKSQGILDRLQMIAMDDALITHKNETSSFVGILPLVQSFENFVPHFIWKDKPAVNYGNMYAHEIGLLADEDTSTGVSFSAVAESYILMGWPSVVLVAPVVWILLFTVFDSLCGDVRKFPLGLIVIVLFAHTAPEGALGGLIYTIGYVTFGIVFTAVTATYVMPIIGTLVVGPEGIAIRRGAPIRSIPNRLRPATPPKI